MGKWEIGERRDIALCAVFEWGLMVMGYDRLSMLPHLLSAIANGFPKRNQWIKLERDIS
ncbi:hypothetical protein [Roseofilum capinflatum]|uniref:Uncharacterized protein n=1 Tax=Roseofilum capinflatum BLCC-M114 TaxID=3022440 RepID=A0ABT7B0T5_9CYAN|nr:hypothetical protein [Roseofilum capinflatum]MDJ1172782.1 hypothetical protein [Roseofilum capinflatum BLCC-M114]